MSDGETKSRKARPYWLPVIIAFIMWLVLTYFYSTPEVVDRTRFTFDEWKNIGYLVTSIMLVWLFVWKITLNTELAMEAEDDKVKPVSKAKDKKTVETEVEEELPKEEAPRPRKKRVVVKDPAADTAAAALDDELPEGLHRPGDEPEEDLIDLPRVIEWEKKDPGGVYSDTLIRVDDNLVLNLRTLLGKVCHNCEELDDCKRRVAGKVDDEIFLFNFDCRDGLKKELHRARKKREKAKAAAAKELVAEKSATAKEDSEGDEGEATAKKATPAKKKATPAKKKATPAKKKATPAKKKATPAKKKAKVTKSTKKKSTSSSSSSKKKKAEADK